MNAPLLNQRIPNDSLFDDIDLGPPVHLSTSPRAHFKKRECMVLKDYQTFKPQPKSDSNQTPDTAQACESVQDPLGVGACQNVQDAIVQIHCEDENKTQF